jgi:hypothetical protein
VVFFLLSFLLDAPAIKIVVIDGTGLVGSKRVAILRQGGNC